MPSKFRLALVAQAEQVRHQRSIADNPMKQETLVIVPCGQKKIWDRNPGCQSIKAKDAYTGPPFKINRQFAETFGDSWVILSAKYGFVKPSFLIDGPYNATKRFA